MLLKVRGLSKSYGKRYVAREIDLELASGEIVGLLGPNGAGKTTTFYMIVGMIRPDSGDIYLDNEEIKNMPMYLRARKGIGYLPQEPSIFRKLKVRENLEAVLELTGQYDKESLAQKVDKLIEEFNLVSFAEREGYRLSGGERRRAEIARSIALNPKILLFDEPFAGIDPITINDLKKMLIYLKSKGLGVLITDHNVRDTLSITDRAYIINEGVVLAHGNPREIIDNVEVRTAYLGEEFSL
ncbi:MAG: LPS export ABC transporter ATP-binding protein [Thermodesulfovibrionales bacterium]|nr:LPS export ABC transporter ATP-binding protein [Thermodesulfovibrionales bacterium]